MVSKILNKIVKPRWPEIPGGGASFWKRDPVGIHNLEFQEI